MHATFPVGPFIARSELTVAKDLVSSLLSLLGELRVNFAGVDEEGSLRFGLVFLRKDFHVSLA